MELAWQGPLPGSPLLLLLSLLLVMLPVSLNNPSNMLFHMLLESRIADMLESERTLV